MILTTVEWGTVPDWLAAIGTVGALLAGAAILNKQRKSLDQQAETYRWEAEQRERGQALQISGWVECPDADHIIGHVANGSDAPIYSCVLYVKDAVEFESEEVSLSEDGSLQPTGDQHRVVQDIELVFMVVPPQSRESFPYELGAMEKAAIEAMPFPGVQAAVGFVDSHGQSWLRDASGHLTKTDFPPRIC